MRYKYNIKLFYKIFYRIFLKFITKKFIDLISKNIIYKNNQTVKGQNKAKIHM